MTDQCKNLRELIQAQAEQEDVQKDINQKICAWDGCRVQRMSGSDLCWKHK